MRKAFWDGGSMIDVKEFCYMGQTQLSPVQSPGTAATSLRLNSQHVCRIEYNILSLTDTNIFTLLSHSQYSNKNNFEAN